MGKDIPVIVKRNLLRTAGVILIYGCLVSCNSPAEPAATTAAETEIEETVEEVEEPSPIPTDTDEPSPLPSLSPTSSNTPSPSDTPGPPTSTPYPEPWMNMPVIPEVSDTAREIYALGLKRGNNPKSFSIVGDCQSVMVWFLGFFEQPDQYSLGDEYAYLQETIDNFKGSFYRERYAVEPGMTVSAALSPLWADPEACYPYETPIACEYRHYLPSIVIISIERKADTMVLEDYEMYLREIIEYFIDNDVVPILSTKADNIEGDWSINALIVDLAQEYDVPLWNFWRAVQHLPNHGMQPDERHITFARPYFDDPEAMQHAWPYRNLTALQSIDAVWRAVREED